MKKIILTIIFIFLITGCTKTIKFNEKDIIEFKIDNYLINKEDYHEIISDINSLYYSKRGNKQKVIKKLTITTKKDIYIISIYKNNTLQIKYQNRIYYSKNRKKIKKVMKKLDIIENKYKNFKFYKIDYKNNYLRGNNDFLIKIDNVDSYFIIKHSIAISKVQINKVEDTGNNYQDVDLIYNLENQDIKNDIVIRMNPIQNYYRYKITITNIYGLESSIIPTYDIEKETGKLKYIIHNKKNNILQ